MVTPNQGLDLPPVDKTCIGHPVFFYRVDAEQIPHAFVAVLTDIGANNWYQCLFLNTDKKITECGYSEFEVYRCADHNYSTPVSVDVKNLRAALLLVNTTYEVK